MLLQTKSGIIGGASKYEDLVVDSLRPRFHSLSLLFQSSPLPAGLKRSHFYYASDLAEQRLQAEAARAAAADELAPRGHHTSSSSAIPAVFALTAAAQGRSILSLQTYLDIELSIKFFEFSKLRTPLHCK